MSDPLFLRFYSEKIGKPLSAFTKDDWKRAAIGAAQLLDAPKLAPKKRGRPRRVYRLGDLMKLDSDLWTKITGIRPTKKPRGAPLKQYGKNKNYSIEMIAEIVAEITSPAVRKKWPDEAPWSKAEAVRGILRSIGHSVCYEKSVLRALRRLKSGQKSKIIGG